MVGIYVKFKMPESKLIEGQMEFTGAKAGAEERRRVAG